MAQYLEYDISTSCRCRRSAHTLSYHRFISHLSCPPTNLVASTIFSQPSHHIMNPSSVPHNKPPMTTIAPPTITTSNPTPTPDFSLHALSTPPVLAGLATVPVVGGTALAYVKFATGPALIPLTTYFFDGAPRAVRSDSGSDGSSALEGGRGPLR